MRRREFIAVPTAATASNEISCTLSNSSTCGQLNSFAVPSSKNMSPETMRRTPRMRGDQVPTSSFITEAVCIFHFLHVSPNCRSLARMSHKG
jgi:hypothetical protein